MSEFSAQVVRDIQGLPEQPDRADLLKSGRNLLRLVAAKSPPDAVAKAANDLRWAMIAAYKVQIAPTRIPDMQASAVLHSNASAKRWQHFIRERVSVALGAQPLWAMALVSFLAVEAGISTAPFQGSAGCGRRRRV